ncbi:MAG: hypothetical protein ACU843_19125 [Gammaproteobacteria bacterium]
MEYVIVKFAHSRAVYVDGNETGTTNSIFRIGPGLHDFNLGTPLDYRPPNQQMTIQGTNALAPTVIEFDPVETS